MVAQAGAVLISFVLASLAVFCGLTLLAGTLGVLEQRKRRARMRTTAPWASTGSAGGRRPLRATDGRAAADSGSARSRRRA